MKIGISYWGYCEKFEDCKVAETPDGHRYGRPILVDELIKRGHEVIALQPRREGNPYPGLTYSLDYPDLDALFVEWRWPTYKNSGSNKFEPDLDRQEQLLKHYHGQVPVIAWDTDLKITADDEIRWPNMIIADPSLEPVHLTRKRERLTFWTDFKEYLECYSHPMQYGYIGNNYQRETQFEKYYSLPASPLRSDGIQTTIYGNWLNISPERKHPSAMIKQSPYVSFVPRVGFYDSMIALNKFICTTHISKQNYLTLGNVTVRYFETLACNVPALVPAEFHLSGILGDEWKIGSTGDVLDAVRKLAGCNVETRKMIVNDQRETLKKFGIFDVKNTADFIEAVV